MSREAADKLARSRLAIVEHVQRRERRPERGAPREDREAPRAARAVGADGPAADEGPDAGFDRRYGARSWFDRGQRAARMWWRHHPASMAVDLATPVLQSYARRHPARLMAGAAVAGAVLMLARPWRLISVTTLVVAVLKSSQLSSLVMSALSAADFGRDMAPHEQDDMANQARGAAARGAPRESRTDDIQ